MLGAETEGVSAPAAPGMANPMVNARPMAAAPTNLDMLRIRKALDNRATILILMFA